MKKILIESLLVAALGLAVALVANALSPRGLQLTRNYFPEAPPAPVTVVPATGETNGTASAPANTPAPGSTLAQLYARLTARGLQLAESNQVVQLFNDPRRKQELVIFIDARRDDEYAAGHIPGAYLFDHFYADKYLATVIPACQKADEIVVYCNGGECEASEFAADQLHTALPQKKFLVYVGGVAEWKSNNLPLVPGPREATPP